MILLIVAFCCGVVVALHKDKLLELKDKLLSLVSPKKD